MLEFEENKLFNIIVREQPTSFEQAHFITWLDCSAFCHEELCYFCSDVVPLCRECNSCPGRI